MNHIYRLIWNAVSLTWQAVAETSRGAGKRGTRRRTSGKSSRTPDSICPTGFNIKILSLVIAGTFSNLTYADPTGGQVSAGSASISKSGNLTTINQASQRAAINWNSFSVGANEAVRFNQPNPSAAILNRVTGRESSNIMGSLSANGQVFIINPNGVLFGAGAQVNVGGLTASSLGLSDADFMANRLKFLGDINSGSVSNQGNINVAPGGTIAFMAPLVNNSGTLSAPEGNVLLAGAEAVTLTLQDGSPFSYTLDKGSAAALVKNGGLIQAGGGHVILTAKGVDAVSRAAVNHNGVIEAKTVGIKNGVIELLGDMESGTVTAGGKLDASAPNGGDGGFVETSAATVKVLPEARVTTLAPQGQTGAWLIDPRDYNVAAAGGDITGVQLSANLATTNVAIASSSGAGAGNGDINVKDAVNWSANRLTLTAARDINITAVMNATGSAALTLNTATANGADVGVAGGTVNVANGGRVDFDRTGNTFLTINGNAYQVINSLGASTSNTGTDLQGMRATLGGHYALGGNIDASATVGWEAGAGFAPIGAFTGSFDGLGHSITGLTISRPGTAGVGLFSSTTGAATVRNVNLAGGSINGLSNVGALVGTNNGTINNVSASAAVTYSGPSLGLPTGGLVGENFGTIARSSTAGTVTGRAAGHGHIGGLVGDNYGGQIIDSSSSVTVIGGGDFHVGGLVGSNKAAIVNSFATGDVSGDTAIGGLVGVNYSTGTITRSYATGSVTGTGVANVPISGGVGGLIGQAGDDFINGGGTIRDSYATGSVRDLGNNSPGVSVDYRNGGLIGQTLSNTTVINSYSTGSVTGLGSLAGFINRAVGSSGGNTVTNSYWDTQTSGQSTSVGGGTGKTTVQMQQQATFTGWDFSNTWRIVEGTSYPLLRAFTVGTLTLNAQARDAIKVYDATPWIGGTVIDYSGFQNGDTTAILQGSIVWGGTAPGAVNAGIYSFIPSGLFSTKYEIVYGNGTLTVVPRPLNLTASKTYDASASFAASQFAVGNVISGDTVALTGSATVASANAGQYTSFATNGLSTGNTNYTAVGGNIDVKINRAVLGLVAATADDKSKTYGSIDPALTYTITTNGLVNGDTLSGNLVRVPGEDVAIYAINQGTLTGGPNYDLRFTPGAFTINPANLVISATSSPKTYDGTTSVSATPTVISGTLFNNQSLSGGSFAFNDPNAGTGKTVLVSGVTVNDGNNGNNYNVQYTNAQDGEIRQRPVDIAVSKTFDTNPTFTQGFTAGNVVPGDSVGVSGTASVASADAGRYSNFTFNGLTLNNTNYTLVGGRVDATINQALLQLVAAKATDASKIYGAADPAEFSYDVTSNPLGATLTGNLVRDPGEDVRDGGYAIRQGTLKAGDNFQLQFTNGVFTINPAGAYLWGNDYSITLGDTRPSSFTFRVVGVDGREISTSNFSGVNISAPGVGLVPTIGGYALPIAGGSSSNKNFTIRERYAGTLTVLPTKDMITLALLSDLTTLDGYRDALNQNLPTSNQAGAPGSPWVLLPFEKAILHQDGIGAAERKFIHPDGREVVFDGDTAAIVTDPRYMGTYNFGTDPALFSQHTPFDVIANAIANPGQFIDNLQTGYLDNDLSSQSSPSSDTSTAVSPPPDGWSVQMSQPIRVTPSLEKYSSVASLNPFTAYYATSIGATNESLKQLYSTLADVRASQVNDLLQAVGFTDGYDEQIEAMRSTTDPQALMKLTDKLAASLGELTTDINRISQFTAGVDSVFDLANIYLTGAETFKAATLAKDVVGNIFTAAEKFKGGLVEFDKALLNSFNEARQEFGSLYGADLEQSAIAIMKKNNFDDSLAKLVGQKLGEISMGDAKKGYDAVQSVFDAITLVGGMAKAKNDTQAFTEFLTLSDKADYLKMVAQDYLTMKLGPETAQYQNFYSINKVDRWVLPDNFKLVQTEVNVLTGTPNP